MVDYIIQKNDNDNENSNNNCKYNSMIGSNNCKKSKNSRY